MFCYQCQETAKNEGCTVAGGCGKPAEVANLQDLLIYVLKGISLALTVDQDKELAVPEETDRFILESLFKTITNANFDAKVFIKDIKQGLSIRDRIIQDNQLDLDHDALTWTAENELDLFNKALEVGVLSEKKEDIRSLKQLITYGLKGIAAYAEHAFVLGNQDQDLFRFIKLALAATLDETITLERLIELVMECGKYGVTAMSLLDGANTSAYGNPEITTVNLGVGKNPGILISGHDLKDMEELLEQTKDSGVDIYTHSEMLPANYYPAFKKYTHFIGNYGNAWWKQKEEFANFNGPILLTTNCLVPPLDSYKDRVYTTGSAGFAGVKHIADRLPGKQKDFSELIKHAKNCTPPIELEKGEIIGGFAHAQVLALADKIVEAVKSGAIKKFVVMAGCDGRMKSREYYSDFAQKLPQDSVILTAGCAKYRYNKLKLGDINGIPRVLDAGQCNDSYSLAVIALKLKEVFGLDDINELPIVYNIAWYEQKAVIVLLALLYLGVKNIHLGPTLPAFLSPNVVKVLVEKFQIAGITDVENDLELLFQTAV